MNFIKRHLGEFCCSRQLHASLSRLPGSFFKTKNNNYEKLLSILVFFCPVLLCVVPHCSSVDTISGLKSKLLCWQQMSFKICLQSRNMCSLKKFSLSIFFRQCCFNRLAQAICGEPRRYLKLLRDANGSLFLCKTTTLFRGKMLKMMNET
jgi:hypothetical protein